MCCINHFSGTTGNFPYFNVKESTVFCFPCPLSWRSYYDFSSSTRLLFMLAWWHINSPSMSKKDLFLFGYKVPFPSTFICLSNSRFYTNRFLDTLFLKSTLLFRHLGCLRFLILHGTIYIDGWPRVPTLANSFLVQVCLSGFIREWASKYIGCESYMLQCFLSILCLPISGRRSLTFSLA